VKSSPSGLLLLPKHREGLKEMLQPKRVKYRKAHRGHRRGTAQAGYAVLFGDFGLQAQGGAWLTARQIEAARRAIVHSVKRGGKVWIRVFPDKPVTSSLPRQEWAAARALSIIG